ncbi:sulfotransferase 1C2-like [Mizuhopecten yessoensis]|nr:sulfotransferase 1C2-like [Mizuhopecten yessoensis]
MRDAKSKKKANMMERIEEGIQQSDRIVLKDVKENISENSVIRKGIVGDWKSLFTPEQTDRFNTLYRQRALPSHPLEFKEYLET